MKLTLTITASASALANILSLIENGNDAVVVGNHIDADTYVPKLPVFPSAAPVMPEVVAAAPTVNGEPEFDSTGLAWDDRIHSKQKGQTNDGKWRKQRGVDDAYYNAIEAELRARYGAQIAPEVAGNAIPMPSVAPVAMEHGVVAAVNAVSEMPAMMVPVAVAAPQPIPMPVPIPVPVAAPQPVPVAAPQPVTFHTVMTHVGASMGAGTITPDYLVNLVNEINQQCGTAMSSFTDMAAFPNAIEYCWAAFARDGKL